LWPQSFIFFLGEPRDGAIMLIFVVGIISIDVIQEWKTDKTLKRAEGFVGAAHHRHPRRQGTAPLPAPIWCPAI
jgi:hypothetical protein